MSIAGALTNSGSLNIGNFYVGGPDEVTAASLDNTGSISLKAGAILDVTGALTNTGGLSISQAASVCTVGTLSNSGSISDNGTIDVTSGVAGFGTAGTVTGSVSDSFGNVEFASGQISTIAAGSSLSLNSGFIEDSTALGSNSALTGLSDIAGSLYLVSAPVSTTGAVANSGLISIGAQYSAPAGSLSIAGALTNTGRLDIGSGEASSSVTAESFVNSGTVDLNAGTLDVSGTTANNGSISIAYAAVTLAGAVDGTGSFSLPANIYGPTNLQFELERFVRADHHRDRQGHGRAHPRGGAVLRRHDQRFRNRRHDRRDELRRDRNDVQFRREFGHDGRHAHAHRHEF